MPQCFCWRCEISVGKYETRKPLWIRGPLPETRCDATEAFPNRRPGSANFSLGYGMRGATFVVTEITVTVTASRPLAVLWFASDDSACRWAVSRRHRRMRTYPVNF